MDAANAQDTLFDEEPTVDRYLLALWPAEPAPDAVIRQTGEFAAYWHREAHAVRLPREDEPGRRGRAAPRKSRSRVNKRRPGPVIEVVTFEQFAMARLQSLLRYAIVLTGDRDLAQDVVQEVLARAQVKWRRISKADSPEAYVRRMVLNEYLSWRRSWASRHVHAVGERLVDLDDARGGVQDHAQGVVDADELWHRLAGLGRKQRAVLVLRYYEQLADEAIADLIGCSPATVRSHASRALKTLRLSSESPHLISAEEKS